MKVGILGGTFNPVHQGHVTMALGALGALGLQEVWWIPAGRPPHKAVEREVSAEHRYRMVEKAIEGVPQFKILPIEKNRPGPSYTVDTLTELARLHPANEWFFITGSDVVPELSKWRAIERALKLATFVVVARPGAEPPLPAGVKWLDVPPVDVSSSEIRRRIRTGRSIAGLVPEPVARYINEQRLYR